MSGSPNLLDVIDRMMAAPKIAGGVDLPPIWRDGWPGQEPAASFPLEIEGELRGLEGMRLLVVGLPDAPGLQFRLGILLQGSVCRLDHTDEVHANSYRMPEDALPPLVRGPHYHSWILNRRFFKGVTSPPLLRNAESYGGPGSLDRVAFPEFSA
jgi:hypothetical protein